MLLLIFCLHFPVRYGTEDPIAYPSLIWRFIGLLRHRVGNISFISLILTRYLVDT